MICINRDKLCTNEKITNLSYLESAVRKKIWGRNAKKESLWITSCATDRPLNHVFVSLIWTAVNPSISQVLWVNVQEK